MEKKSLSILVYDFDTTRTRTPELDAAFRNGQIMANGYVDSDNRHLQHIRDYVSGSKFTRNPADLAISIIIAHNASIAYIYLTNLFRSNSTEIQTNKNHHATKKNTSSRLP